MIIKMKHVEFLLDWLKQNKNKSSLIDKLDPKKWWVIMGAMDARSIFQRWLHGCFDMEAFNQKSSLDIGTFIRKKACVDQCLLKNKRCVKAGNTARKLVAKLMAKIFDEQLGNNPIRNGWDKATKDSGTMFAIFETKMIIRWNVINKGRIPWHGGQDIISCFPSCDTNELLKRNESRGLSHKMLNMKDAYWKSIATKLKWEDVTTKPLKCFGIPEGSARAMNDFMDSIWHINMKLDQESQLYNIGANFYDDWWVSHLGFCDDNFLSDDELKKFMHLFSVEEPMKKSMGYKYHKTKGNCKVGLERMVKPFWDFWDDDNNREFNWKESEATDYDWWTPPANDSISNDDGFWDSWVFINCPRLASGTIIPFGTCSQNPITFYNYEKTPSLKIKHDKMKIARTNNTL